MELTTEYLVIIEKDASPIFYHLGGSVEGFNTLLQTDSNIKIAPSLIKYKDDLSVPYEIRPGKVEGKDQRYFHIKLSFNGEESDIDKFTTLLRAIRSTVKSSKGEMETLWDDVSLYYSNKSYPLIHNVENLMRKLITYFMLTNVGKEWVAETSPTSVKEAINKSKRQEYVNVLHQIDFNQLGDFLFKAYPTRNISELYKAIDNASEVGDLNLDDLKEFKERSNWDRYFSKVVECTNEYLKNRWSDLYDLRCMVAHNAIIGRAEYEKIEKLVSEVEQHLKKAIDNLGSVHVPIEDKEQLAETVVSNTSTLSGNFIELWRAFTAVIARVAVDQGILTQDQTRRSPKHVLQVLYTNGAIDDELFKEGQALVDFRNRLVHGSEVEITEQEIGSYIIRLESLTRALRRSWKDEVVNTLTALGGRASLQEIYDYIENNTSRKLPSTWDSAVRKTLQEYSSDTDAYKESREDLFKHLEKGVWALRILDEASQS
ncbi:MAG TPA: hypothetical protein VGN95_25335 [Pyrinomonadaceae bacterium]|jgi:hypothetical protein|nr:hypothetical protein [Pyrinomonadaceae bacterium]